MQELIIDQECIDEFSKVNNRYTFMYFVLEKKKIKKNENICLVFKEVNIETYINIDINVNVDIGTSRIRYIDFIRCNIKDICIDGRVLLNIDNTKIERMSVWHLCDSTIYLNNATIDSLEATYSIFKLTNSSDEIGTNKIKRLELDTSMISNQYSTLDNIEIDKINNVFGNGLSITPETGSFIGYKKAGAIDNSYNCEEDSYFYYFIDNCKDVIIKLEIQEDSLRSSAFSRKCRASKVKVLDIYDPITKQKYNKARNTNYGTETIIYEVGKVIEVKDFDTNRLNECAPGIHFFLSESEAVEY